MDEEERRREEVKGSPHEVVGNNTAVGSGEERTPQSARQQGNESQVRGSHAGRSASLSALYVGRIGDLLLYVRSTDRLSPTQ